jgi:hypothetical protein
MKTWQDIEDWGATMVRRLKGWLDPPMGPDARPLEVQHAIVDLVADRAEPTGPGCRVLPYNRMTVAVLAADRQRRAALEAGLAGLDAAVRTRLAEIRCPVPGGFQLRVHYVKQRPPGWSSDQEFALQADQVQNEGGGDGRAAVPVLRVTIARGRTARTSYVFAGSPVRIGRTTAPVDRGGRVRTNDIAFVETDEHSRSVGRAHASRVVRAGAMLDVVPRDPVGVAIASGDEIQFGTAAVRVHVERGAARDKVAP